MLIGSLNVGRLSERCAVCLTIPVNLFSYDELTMTGVGLHGVPAEM